MENNNLAIAALGMSFLTLVLLIVGGIMLNTKLNAAAEMTANDDTDSSAPVENAVATDIGYEDPSTVSNRHAEILVHAGDDRFGYMGIAEFTGYHTRVKQHTTLDESGPMVDCEAFVITDGPVSAIEQINKKTFGLEPSVIVLGKAGHEVTSPWWNTPEILNSTITNQVRAIFSIGSKFESSVVGCMEPRAAFIGTVPFSNK